ncbi:MAG: malonyl-[acyl-carrier protein] O-methyltransferase BioC, partial [Pseudomonadota bacterium]
MTDPDLPQAFELSAVQRAFDQAAPGYDNYAVLQRQVADNLLDNLDLFTIKPRRVIDLGAGTGYCASALIR